jgi:hypothetical protein
MVFITSIDVFAKTSINFKYTVNGLFLKPHQRTLRGGYWCEVITKIVFFLK